MQSHPGAFPDEQTADIVDLSAWLAVDDSVWPAGLLANASPNAHSAGTGSDTVTTPNVALNSLADTHATDLGVTRVDLPNALPVDATTGANAGVALVPAAIVSPNALQGAEAVNQPVQSPNALGDVTEPVFDIQAWIASGNVSGAMTDFLAAYYALHPEGYPAFGVSETDVVWLGSYDLSALAPSSSVPDGQNTANSEFPPELLAQILASGPNMLDI